jgi:hypothetical protein
MKVQQWLDDDQAAPENEYEAITCPACARLHFLNHATPPRCGHNGPEGEAAKAISRNTGPLGMADTGSKLNPSQRQRLNGDACAWR